MKILFLSLTNIGDVILSTLLINRILETHPGAQFDIICGPRATSLFEGCPQVRRVIPLQKKKYKKHHWQLLTLGWQEHYDWVVDLRTPLWGYLVRAKNRLMGRHKKHGLVWKHYADLWPSSTPAFTSVWPSDATQKSTLAWLEARRVPHTKLVALCPTAAWEGKMWPKANVAGLLELYRDKDVQFIVLGSPHEKVLVEGLFTLLPPGRVLDGFHTSLTEAAVLLAQCDAVVANDSGLAHLAGAAGAPLITLFGPMDENIYTTCAHPHEVLVAPEAAPGTHTLPPDVKPRPMGGITPQSVAAVVDRFLQQGKGA